MAQVCPNSMIQTHHYQKGASRLFDWKTHFRPWRDGIFHLGYIWYHGLRVCYRPFDSEEELDQESGTFPIKCMFSFAYHSSFNDVLQREARSSGTTGYKSCFNTMEINWSSWMNRLPTRPPHIVNMDGHLSASARIYTALWSALNGGLFYLHTLRMVSLLGRSFMAHLQQKRSMNSSGRKSFLNATRIQALGR